MNASAGPTSTDDWNRHWSAYAETNALNPAQAYRRKLIFGALNLERAKAPLRLLEIGSGQGEFSRELKGAYPELELVGLDLSQTGVEIARTKVPGAVFFQQDLTQTMALPATYRSWATHAVCSEVLEHIDDPVLALRNIRTCLASGGKLVVTVPAGPVSAFDRHIGHRRHFTPDQLKEVLEEAGLQVASLYGAGFPFFNLYRLSVVARGKKLIADATQAGSLPLSARVAIKLFSSLFRANLTETRRGWQLVATAVEPVKSSVARGTEPTL